MPEQIVKTYPNGQTLTIYDDGVSPVATLKATLSKIFTAVDGETYSQVVLDATDNDLTSEIEQLTEQITSLTTRKTQLITKRTALRAELTKLPARPA